MRVLESKAIGVTPRGAATAQRAREEIGERSKVQATAIARIEKLVDSCAPKFITKLQIMSRALPGRFVLRKDWLVYETYPRQVELEKRVRAQQAAVWGTGRFVTARIR